MNELKRSIRERAIDIGFETVGFAAAAADPNDRRALEAFLDLGSHGDMHWIDDRGGDRAGSRGDPLALMPAARSVIVLGANYGPASDPLTALEHRERGAISVYAQGVKDYHDVVKKRLKRLARWLVDSQGGEVKVFVDTAPVMEKPLAARAGLGWQGKHTNLVSRDWGSWLFLGEVFTTLEIAPDLPAADHCGSCDACRRVCPTDAIPESYELDAKRCISYLTIEHKGEIAPDLMAAMGNHIYGCDDCLAVCPWNKYARPAVEPKFQPREELVSPRLADLAVLDDAAFRQRFKGSAIKRTGRDRFVRNVLIAIGNSGNAELVSVAAQLTNDASPLVAATARWAAARLGASAG